MGLPEEDIKRALDLLMTAGLVTRTEGGAAVVNTGILEEIDQERSVASATQAEENRPDAEPASDEPGRKTGSDDVDGAVATALPVQPVPIESRECLDHPATEGRTRPDGVATGSICELTPSVQETSPPQISKPRKQRKPRNRNDAGFERKARQRKQESPIPGTKTSDGQGFLGAPNQLGSGQEREIAPPEPLIPPFEIQFSAEVRPALEIDLPPADANSMEIALPDDPSGEEMEDKAFDTACGQEPNPESEPALEEATALIGLADTEVVDDPSGRPAQAESVQIGSAHVDDSEVQLQAPRASHDLDRVEGQPPEPVSVPDDADLVCTPLEDSSTPPWQPVSEIEDSSSALDVVALGGSSESDSSVKGAPEEGTCVTDAEAGPDYIASPAEASGSEARKPQEVPADAGEAESFSPVGDVECLQSPEPHHVAESASQADAYATGAALEPDEAETPSEIDTSEESRLLLETKFHDSAETTTQFPATIEGDAPAASQTTSEPGVAAESGDLTAHRVTENLIATDAPVGEPLEAIIEATVAELEASNAQALAEAEAEAFAELAMTDAFQATVNASLEEVEVASPKPLTPPLPTAFADPRIFAQPNSAAVESSANGEIVEPDDPQQPNARADMAGLNSKPQEADCILSGQFLSVPAYEEEAVAVDERTTDRFFGSGMSLPADDVEEDDWQETGSAETFEAPFQTINSEPLTLSRDPSNEAVSQEDLSDLGSSSGLNLAFSSDFSGIATRIDQEGPDGEADFSSIGAAERPEPPEAGMGDQAQRLLHARSALPGEEIEDAEDEADQLYRAIKELEDRIRSLEGADYYYTLGIDRLASTARINRAYESKKQTLAPYRERWAGSAVLNDKLNFLLARYSEAYTTLADLEKRRLYDQPTQGASGGAASRPADFEGNSSSSIPPIRVAIPSTRAWSKPSANANRGATPPKIVPIKIPPIPAPAPPLHTSALTPTGNTTGTARTNGASTNQGISVPEIISQIDSPYQLAAVRFQQGVGLFKKKDIYGALPLFREAAKLDARKAEHHYYLGLTLSILSRARKTHTHDSGCHVTCTLEGNLPPNQRVRHEAVEHLRRAAELDPQNVQVLADLAALYQDAGMPKKAEYYLDRAMLLNPGNQTAAASYGVINRNSSDDTPPGPPSKKPPKK